MARKITVIVDSREQRPFRFPHILAISGVGCVIETVTQKLSEGDYAIKGALDKCVIERKGCATEIAKNMLDPNDRRRQLRAFDRLAKCKFPIIVIEQSLGEFMLRADHLPDPGAAVDALFPALLERGIHPWFVGNCDHSRARNAVGELLLRLMVAVKDGRVAREPPTIRDLAVERAPRPSAQKEYNNNA